MSLCVLHDPGWIKDWCSLNCLVKCYIILLLWVYVRVLMLLEFCFVVLSGYFFYVFELQEKCPLFGSWCIQTTSAGRKIICHWSRWELAWQTMQCILNIHNMHNMVSVEWNCSFRVFAVPCIVPLIEQRHYNSKIAMPVWGIKHQEEKTYRVCNSWHL